MLRITLTIILLLSATADTIVDAAWYQKTDGTIVDPIQSVEGGDLSYSGNNLQPDADLINADLINADLRHAWLIDADLTGALMDNAKLTDANLDSANLTDSRLIGVGLAGADLTGADLTAAFLAGASLAGASLAGVDLSGSYLSGVLFYDTATWTGAFYYTNNEPTWDSDMDAAWRASEGILALAPTISVPEPSTILLALIGLALLPRRRRR